ncbi:MAG: T9SS type A sorting domain-containing protein [Hymenobacteraceae bacterium]|nr:T9SS type A sorting domain-containing protein [Hymenobacteraceae bacterium]
MVPLLRVLFAACILFSAKLVTAQSINIDHYQKSFYTQRFNNKSKSLQVWSEAPPVVLNTKSNRLYISTTFFSTAWTHGQNLAIPMDDEITLPKSIKGNYVTSSLHWWHKFYDPAYLDNPEYIHRQEWQNHHWRRNYNGIFSAHVLPASGKAQSIVLAFSHGENKNERIGNYYYQNTVRPSFVINKQDSRTYSGGNPYVDCWEAYFGFLNGNWAFTDNVFSSRQMYFNDIGPVAWPSAGYVSKDGQQLSHGLRHPSSIVHDDQLYIFVVDTSMDGTGGVKLVRVNTKDALQPQMYVAWTRSGWAPALPDGFSTDHIQQFFSRRGPTSVPVISNDKNTVRFSVARVKNSSSDFLGIEEYIDADNKIYVAIRYSNDLINWTEREVVYSAASWDDSVLKYPVFMDTEGFTNGVIDESEFYILGTTGDGSLTKLRFFRDACNNDTTNSKSRIESITKCLTSDLAIPPTLEEVSVAPNFTSSSINVYLTVTRLSRVQMSLVHASGKTVRGIVEETLQPQTVKRVIDVSSLNPGVYYLVVSDEETKLVRKFVKI